MAHPILPDQDGSLDENLISYVYEVVEDQGEIFYDLGLFYTKEEAIEFVTKNLGSVDYEPPSVDGAEEPHMIQIREREFGAGHGNWTPVWKASFVERYDKTSNEYIWGIESLDEVVATVSFKYSLGVEV